MKNTTVQISFDAEKLNALRHYMGDKETDISTELEDALTKIYRRVVPREVQNFLEMRDARDVKKEPRPKRPVPAQPSSLKSEHRPEADES